MKYIQIVLSGKDLDAVEYGRTYLNKFGEKYDQGEEIGSMYQECLFINTLSLEVQRLFGALAYISKLSQSPYNDICSRSYWTDIRQEFQRDFCSLLKMSAESPLYTR